MRNFHQMSKIPFVFGICLVGMTASLFCVDEARTDPSPRIDSSWTRVLAGDAAAGPVPFGDRCFIVTDDRSVAALDVDGRFLWSRGISGRPAPFMGVSPEGLILAFSEPGTITAVSQDGYLLWRMKRSKLPSGAPVFAPDGRIYIVYADEILCLSSVGRIKWAADLPEDAAGHRSRILSQDGSGNLLVCGDAKDVIRVSPFGEIVERVAASSLSDSPLSIAGLLPNPGGYYAYSSDGRIVCFDVRDTRAPNAQPTEAIWEIRESASVSAWNAIESALVLLCEDGSLSARNSTDGALLWRGGTGGPVLEPAVVDVSRDQITVIHSGTASSWSFTGSSAYRKKTVASIREPAMTSSGFAYLSRTDSIIDGVRLENRIGTEKKHRKTQRYAILVSEENPWIGLFPAQNGAETTLFSRITADLSEYGPSTREPRYARELVRILENPASLSSNRQRAAALLGQLGSLEYRAFLLEYAYKNKDPFVMEGILAGLTECGPDFDGSVLDALRYMSGEGHSGNESLQLALCDALYSVIRYTGGSVAYNGTQMLASFAVAPYSDRISNRARFLLARLLD